MTIVEPRTGPCSPWVGTADVQGWSYPRGTPPIPDGIAAQMAMVASEVCWALSARQFTGVCGPVTVRPESHPTDEDSRYRYHLPVGGPYGTAWNQGAGSAVVNHYGGLRPPEVDLGYYPVIEVDSVKIDGETIPPSEYTLRDFRKLVRVRPNAAATPTERYGWPQSQLLDLPDTEQGTFSVTLKFGVPPPASGVLAAQWLAAQLALDALGQKSDLPKRMTAVTRQGVSVAVADVTDFFKNGQTGVWEVDLFVHTWNPHGNRVKPMVWSPDLGRAQRT